MNCPLCNSLTQKSFVANGKTYHQCDTCGLVYMDKNDRLASNEEKTRYSYHQNSIDNDGYVQFLNRIMEPSMQYLSAGMSGIDYGCGPNPVLAQMAEKNGLKCDYYDPFFFPQIDIERKYDFVFATECFEHFFSPANELKQICNILNIGGILGIMTEFVSDKTDFCKWYYKNDPTHVCFYGEKSLEYICKTYGFKELYNDNQRVIILRKI